MHSIQAQSIKFSPSHEKRPSMVLTSLGTFFAAIEEGFHNAERYEALARKSNSELAAAGLTRADLPRFVMFGNHKRRHT